MVYRIVLPFAVKCISDTVFFIFYIIIGFILKIFVTFILEFVVLKIILKITKHYAMYSSLIRFVENVIYFLISYMRKQIQKTRVRKLALGTV